MKEKSGNARVKLFRFDPTVDREPRYEDYEIPPEGWHGIKVIDTVRYIYEHFAPELSFREPCRQQLCGACTLTVNKRAVLACDTLSEEEMVIEPIPRRRVLKDLVVDTSGEKNGE
jgi:succinate dehydrogenase / fumarate reductase, iron-sulfur subunit